MKLNKKDTKFVSCNRLGTSKSDWKLQLVDDEYFFIFTKIGNELIFLNQVDNDRSVYGDKGDGDKRDGFQWQLIPIEGGKSFLIMNKDRKSYLRLGEDRKIEASQGVRSQNSIYAWRLQLSKPKEIHEGSQSLLALFWDSSLSDNHSFLSEIARRFPELQLYGTLSDITPDLVARNSKAPNESLVVAVFGQEKVQFWKDNAGGIKEAYTKIAEINKVLLRLIYLRSLMRNDRRYFPLIAPERLNYISKNLVLPCCQDEKTFELLVLSTIWDALGRTKTIQDVIDQLKIQPAFGHQFKYGHDESWRSFIRYFSKTSRSSILEELIPSFNNLSNDNKKLYISHIATNTFNLGAFVQGESVPYCLYELLKDGNDCQIRLLVLLISSIPIQHNSLEAVGFTNATYDQFTTALTVISEVKTSDNPNLNLSIESYKKYLSMNAQMVGVPTEIPAKNKNEILALHRIVALSRSRFPIHWRKVWFVWRRLSLTDQDTLTHNLTVGFYEGNASIYIYYAPAIISNTMEAARKQYPDEQFDEVMFHEDAWTIGLYHSLIKLAEIYRKSSIPSDERYYIHYGKQEADDARDLVNLDNKDLI